MKLLEKLPPFGRKSGKLNVVIDTPRDAATSMLSISSIAPMY